VKEQGLQKLHFTVRQWKKFDLQKQEILTKRYEILLTRYKTLEQRIIDFVNLEWLKKKNDKKSDVDWVKKFHNGLDTFSKDMNDFEVTPNVFPEDGRKENDKRIRQSLGLGEQKDHSEMIWERKTLSPTSSLVEI